MSSTVGLSRLSPAEQVLSNADLVGLITSQLLHDDGDRGLLATRAGHSLCLTNKPVRAAVLASVQRVCVDRLLPVLQQMASLVSLHIGPGPLDSLAQLRQLTCLQADSISSPQALSAIMQLTRLQELRLGSDADDSADTRRALQQCISSLRKLSSLCIRVTKMQQLPDTIGTLTALSSLVLSSCDSLQQLPADNPQQPGPGQLQQPAAAA
jgi:hypothetical protein